MKQITSHDLKTIKKGLDILIHDREVSKNRMQYSTIEAHHIDRINKLYDQDLNKYNLILNKLNHLISLYHKGEIK